MSAPNHISLLRETNAAYQKLRAANADTWRDEMSLVAVTTHSASLTPEAAWTRANDRAISAIAGWVRHRSSTYAFAHDDPTIFPGDPEIPGRDDTESGPPLAGEWVMHDGQSVHLRGDPATPGMLTEWTYAEHALPDAVTTGDEILALRQEVVVLRHPLVWEGEKLPVLLYRVYWGLASEEDPSALRRLFSRFAGFALRSDCVRRPGQRAARPTSV